MRVIKGRPAFYYVVSARSIEATKLMKLDFGWGHKLHWALAEGTQLKLVARNWRLGHLIGLLGFARPQHTLARLLCLAPSSLANPSLAAPFRFFDDYAMVM